MKWIVKAVPERADCVEYLQRHIPKLRVCWDEKRCAIDTFKRSLEMAGDDRCVHLEDDIWLTTDFTKKAIKEINTRPDAVIQFFSMRKKDLEIGSRWDNNFLMNQCVYFPRGHSRLMLEFFDGWWEQNQEDHPNGTDQMVCDFLKARREKYWIHVPNLVDHRQQKSVIDPRRSSKRMSKTFQDKAD